MPLAEVEKSCAPFEWSVTGKNITITNVTTAYAETPCAKFAAVPPVAFIRVHGKFYEALCCEVYVRLLCASV